MERMAVIPVSRTLLSPHFGKCHRTHEALILDPLDREKRERRA